MKSLGYKKIGPAGIEDNLIKLVSSDWMLVTAGDNENFNTMTANWGGMGYLWNRPVAFVFIRQERYTYQFIEDNDEFTLSFFDMKNREMRKILNICGTKSGRDCDKVAEASLTTVFSTSGNPAFSQARLILECRKLYAEMLNQEAFIDSRIMPTHYKPGGDGLHKMYIAEIFNVWVK